MEEQIVTAPAETVEVVDIQFRPGQKIYFFDPDGARFAAGDHVIIDTARGAEYGTCVGGNHTILMKDVVAPLRKVIRRATAQDEKTIAENRAKEKKAYDTLFNRRPEQRAKRTELAKKNREHDAKYGKASREGKDLSHTKHGLVYKDSSANRGSKTDMPYDSFIIKVKQRIVCSASIPFSRAE